jgi:hypothetical protein
MARCRGCQAEIEFVRLKSKALMPVESAEPEEYQVWTALPDGVYLYANGQPTTQVRTVDGLPTDHRGVQYRKLVLIVEGEVLTVYQGIEPVAAHPGQVRQVVGPCRVLGVESHFATCPSAANFRGRGQSGQRAE